MSKHGTASQVPGWFVEFQLAALRALPRDISQEIADGWRNNGEALTKVFRNLLIPPLAEPKPEHLINCDADPFIPNGCWSVAEHRKSGMVKWNPAKQSGSLYLSGLQKNGKIIGGNDLRNELKNQPVLNANVLDYLLANPHLIPEEWKGKYVFFWGTIYRDSDGSLAVRCLHWFSSWWHWRCIWLGRVWRDDDSAALLAS